MHIAIDITAHSMPLNSLEHGVGTTSMTNIRLDQDLNPVALSFEPQQDRMALLFETQTNLFGLLLMLQ